MLKKTYDKVCELFEEGNGYLPTRTLLNNKITTIQIRTMLQEGKIEKGSILAIEALDRLTRLEPLEAVNLLSQIVGYGIAIVTVTDGRVFDSHTLNRDMSSLMLAAGSLIRGHEESLRKAGRLQDHYADRRASGAGRTGEKRVLLRGWDTEGICLLCARGSKNHSESGFLLQGQADACGILLLRADFYRVLRG